MHARKTLEYVPDPTKFDLVTHRWDSQGHLVTKNPYRKYIVNGAEYYERPVNSGNLWLENNQAAGRVICEFNDKGHIASKSFDFGAEHIAYTPAPTGAEKIAMELAVERARSAVLQAELDAINRELAELDAINRELDVKTTPVQQGKQAPKLSKQE